MLTIYGRKSSANVQKVLWICSEGNLEFKNINVGGKYGGHTSQEFKKIYLALCAIAIFSFSFNIVYKQFSFEGVNYNQKVKLQVIAESWEIFFFPLGLGFVLIRIDGAPFHLDFA